MEKMTDLLDLLKHHVLDLFSAEEQIIDALPAMIEKAQSLELVSALKDHFQVTKVHRTRLQEVQKLINKDSGSGIKLGEHKGGFFTRFFGGATEKCKAMEGLITEGHKIMGEDMVPEVMDAAIIAAAQKIEHYEISGYGTARAFANELGMTEVERLLTQTLKEEYKADDSLTKLAVGKLNLLAEKGEIGAGDNHTSVKTPPKKLIAKSAPIKKSAQKETKKSSKITVNKPAKKSTGSAKVISKSTRTARPAKKVSSPGGSKGNKMKKAKGRKS